MIPEIGQFALSLALIAALVQSVVPMLGAARGNRLWMELGGATASAQFMLLLVAFAALMWSFVVSDFTVVNVVENSNSLKPMIYKIAGTWGSHEGSLLLWVLILALFGAGVHWFGANVPLSLKARTLAVQGWIGLGFLSFMIFTSNPFDRVFPAPLDGTDLNPLLQHIGLVLHPPLLYLGYVGLSIVFSFAVAALIEGRVDPAWARWVRPWTLAAWISLTGGIALGSWWAYYELGWGGWWFWDPVENVSFMPWLLATALLHSAIVTEKRDTFKSWTILLAILAFSMSLFGTFIVRSGLLTSVHAFAVDPERGIYILGLLGVTIGGSLALYAWRAPSMEGGGLYTPISREAGLLMNNLLLATATATVLFGTLYPLLLEAITGDKISVGPPFFNMTFNPIMMPLLAIMAVGPFLSWKRADLPGVLLRLKWVALVVFCVALFVWYLDTGGPVMGVIAAALGVWLILSSAVEWADRIKLGRASFAESRRRAANLPRAAHGMTLAHLGLGIAVLGMVGSSAFKSDDVILAERGTVVEMAGYTLTFEGVQEVQGPNYIAQRANIRVERDGAFVEVLTPESRIYPVAGMPTTESSVRQTILGDLYVSIARPASDAGAGQWILRVIYEPLINWLWAGSIMMVIAGFLSLSDRRLRVGAPKRARSAPANATPAE
jgi:cytochrome c-type biogenesis protein CcmF